MLRLHPDKVRNSRAEVFFGDAGQRVAAAALLGGSWDLVSRVINRVTRVIFTYNPN